MNKAVEFQAKWHAQRKAQSQEHSVSWEHKEVQGGSSGL